MQIYHRAHHLWLNLEQVLGDVCFLLLPISLLSEGLALTCKAILFTRQQFCETVTNEVTQQYSQQPNPATGLPHRRAADGTMCSAYVFPAPETRMAFSIFATFF